MTKLSKVVLINWMYFQKTTLSLEGNTAIVGVNGTGKSTIIDAIQMLLLGKKTSKFNANANTEKRTLESYVRGSVNTYEKDNLRPGDVITYLALEIIANNQSNIFGMCIEYKSTISKLADPKYFYIKNASLDDTMFVSNNYPKAYDVFSKEMKANYEFIPYQTLFGYQNKLKDILGLKNENTYFKILSRAVGIKNITDCNMFMNQFVLDNNPIDIEAIKKIIEEIDKVSKIIASEENKKNDIEQIVDLGIGMESKNNHTRELEMKITIIKKMYHELQLANLEKSNLQLDSGIKEEESTKTTLNIKKSKLYNQIRELDNAIDNISPDLQNKREKLEITRREYDKSNSNLNTFIARCEEFFPNLIHLKKYKKKSFTDLVDYLGAKEFTSSGVREYFKSFRVEATEFSMELSSKIERNKVDLEKLRDELKSLKNLINNLENNKPVFQERNEKFINSLKEHLKGIYQEDIEVKFLSEYLDISNPEWRNAIEGYLANQKFYIVVPNRCYRDAIKFYNSEKNFYSTKIINGTKLPQSDAKEGTLGEFIVSSNNIALNFARNILNRVHCVGDVLDLDMYDIAITKECMCYQGYATGRINPKFYKESFIGIEGIKNQLANKKIEYSALNDQAIKVYSDYQKLNGFREEVENSNKFISGILESRIIESIDLTFELYDEIENLINDIQFYENDPQYMQLVSEKNKIEDDIKAIDEKTSDIDRKIIQYKATIEKNNSEFSGHEYEIDVCNTELVEYTEQSIDEIKQLIKKEDISKNNLDFLAKEKRKVDDELVKEKVKIESLMFDARNKYSINVEPKFESLLKFKEELSKINDNVFKYNSKLLDFKNSNRKLFFTQFLSKLKRSIDNAKEIIKNLNHSLATFYFGNDSYVIKLSYTENMDLKRILDYAQEYCSDNVDRGLFINSEKEDEERLKIQNILNNYMTSSDVALQNFIVDYRNYLCFDVEVHTSNGVKSLNKVIKSQSGGEVQVPFYILTGVAFKQTLDTRNKDALGIVLYDEAFDKMDSQRIESMLDFYRNKLNIQLVVATPGKLDSLVDNIETILTVIRDGDVAIVSDIKHEI